MRGETMADEVVGGTLLVVHTHLPPDAKEWTAHCARIVAQRAQIHAVMVLAHGPGPNTMQRKELQESWGEGTPPPIAILSRSALIRGVLTALNWFMANRLKPFADNDFAGAFAYLQVGEPAQAEVLAALRRMAGELRVPFPAK